MKTTKQLILCMFLTTGLLFFSFNALWAKSVQEELNTAKKNKKSVFLVVTQSGTDASKAIALANQAVKLAKETIVITLDRSDKDNSAIVNEFKLSSITVPMIMIIASNGIAAGGTEIEGITAEKLAAKVPSAKKAEALSYINTKKAVFIVGYRKVYTDKAKALDNCKIALTLLKGNAGIVEVDLDDSQEQAFLTQIGVDTKSKSTQITVFNSQGKNVGSYSGPTDPKKLVVAAHSNPKSGCAPGASCGPKGCNK